MDLFHILGRYFWLMCLVLSAYQYFTGLRSLASMDSTDLRASSEAIGLRRWFLIVADLPWVVMGWGILIGGVPNLWAFFRRQDRNPYVLAWFVTIFAVALWFAFWVFFLGGAEKMVSLKPFEFKWHRRGFRGSSQGTVELTVSRVKLFAAMGPIWIAVWTWLVWLMDAPVPK